MGMLVYFLPVNLDVRKLIKELKDKRKSDRKKATIYVSESVFEAFKELCEDVSASRVIETWMIQALDEAKKRK